MTGHAAASVFGRSPVSGRSSYTLFQGGLPAALLTIPLRDAVWPLTVMLAHKAVPHECRHLLFTTMCSAIPTSPDSGLTSRCGWTAKAKPPTPLAGRLFSPAEEDPALRGRVNQPFPSCLSSSLFPLSPPTYPTIKRLRVLGSVLAPAFLSPVPSLPPLSSHQPPPCFPPP